MAHVDALSRTVSDVAVDAESVDTELSQRAYVFVALSTKDRVRFMQQADQKTRDRICLLENIGPRTKQETNDLNDYELIDGILHRKYNGRLLLVVPNAMRKGIVIAAHDFGGHFALDRTVAKITRDFWSSRLRRYVRQHINMCLDCLIHKRPSGKRPGLLHPIPPGKRPFQVVNVDHLGPFETSTQRNRYLLVIVDNLTKYVQLFPCRTTDAKSVIRILSKFCEERGIPDRIITDRGTCFTSHSFEQFCWTRNIRHTLNSTRHPQANGQVERANRTIIPLLSLSTEDQRRWDLKVHEVERLLNSAENKTTNKTPFEALHGYRPRFHKGVLGSLSQNSDEWKEPSEVHKEVRSTIEEQQQMMTLSYNRKHYLGDSLDLGEVVVMLKAPNQGQPSKLQSKYRDKPLQVVEKLPGDTYRVVEIAPEGQSTYASTAHISQLKSWKVLKDEDEAEELADGSCVDSDEDTTLNLQSTSEETQEENGAIQPVTTTGGFKRVSRERRTPRYLKDYVPK